MTYRLEYSPAALRDLERLPADVRKVVWARIQALAEDPMPPGAEKLKGGLAPYTKVRTGDYRIVYTIEPEVVFITRVGNRRDIYKQMARLR